jgi:uncharacterized protein (TIGR02246 family)
MNRRTLRSLALGLCFALCIMAPALPQDAATSPTLARDIEALVNRHLNLLIKRDAAGLAGLFTDDAVFVGATGAMVAGRGGIRAFYAQAFATLDYGRSSGMIGNISREVRVVRVHALGDGAWAYGRGRLLVDSPHGLVVRTDHWMAVYAQVGGEWKIRMMSVGEDAELPPERERRR